MNVKVDEMGSHRMVTFGTQNSDEELRDRNMKIEDSNSTVIS